MASFQPIPLSRTIVDGTASSIINAINVAKRPESMNSDECSRNTAMLFRESIRHIVTDIVGPAAIADDQKVYLSLLRRPCLRKMEDTALTKYLEVIRFCWVNAVDSMGTILWSDEYIAKNKPIYNRRLGLLLRNLKGHLGATNASTNVEEVFKTMSTFFTKLSDLVSDIAHVLKEVDSFDLNELESVPTRQDVILDIIRRAPSNKDILKSIRTTLCNGELENRSCSIAWKSGLQRPS